MVKKTTWSVLLLASAWCLTSMVHPAESVATPDAEVYDLVEQGRQALIADKYAESLKLFERAISEPGFAQADPGLQYFAFLLASYAAQGADDNLSAHDFLVAATVFPDADADVWMRRAGNAALLEKWEDAGLSLITVAKKWPQALQSDQYRNWLLGRTVRELGKQPALRKQRLDLLNILFAAGYKAMYGIEPSHLWLVLATDALEHKNTKRAREVARHITDSSVLVAMRIDRRFDALTAAEPRLFDVRAAAEREARYLKNAVNENPKELGALVQYGYALHTLGRFDEMLSLAEGTIAKVEKAPAGEPPYEDLDDQLNWVHNHKATALRALGKWEQAAAALANWQRSDRNRDDKVSQAINLGFFYNEMGRPDDALKAVDGLDWSRGMSEYGRTQYQYVRFQAYQQLGKDGEAQEVVTWMRSHQDDAMETAQSTLLQAGDVDGAATLLLSRLRDADERAIALADIQIYAETPRTERQKKIDALMEALLARADVTAAIEQYGRREKFSIHSLEY